MELPQEVRKLYPYASHLLRVERRENGNLYTVNLHYVDEGRGEPVVCLHGNPTWSFFYRHVIEQLKGQNRVLALDHLGCGLSDRPERFPYRLEAHIENLTTFIDHLGLKRVTLIVHDWGGAIGLGWAVNNLDKVNKLVVMNTAAFRSMDIPKRIAILTHPVLRELLIDRLNLFCRGAIWMASHKGLTKEVAEAYLFPYRKLRDRKAIGSFVQDIPMKKGHPSYNILCEIEKKLSTLQVPTLLLWGAKDFCFHMGFYHRWVEIFPHAETLVMDQAGHYLLEDEHALACERIRKFLL